MTTRHKSIVLSAAALLAATLLVYGQVVGHAFVGWDDGIHVYENEWLSDVTWEKVGRFWHQPYEGLYIPLSYTFFAAEAALSQAISGDPAARSPAVFHAGNLVLHYLSVLVVLAILRRLVPHAGAACVGALLFAVHPLQAEPVAWVSETRGVLSSLLGLVALWQYVVMAEATSSTHRVETQSESPGGKRPAVHYAAALFALLLALLAKPSAVAVLPMAALIDAIACRRPPGRIAASLVPWAVLCLGAVSLNKSLQVDETIRHAAPLWARPFVAADALAFYLQKLVLPLALTADYGRTPTVVIDQAWLYTSWLIPAALVAALCWLRVRVLWLAAGLFVAGVLPVLGLVPFGYQDISTVADRYVYLAMLGPALALAWLLATRPSRVVFGVSLGVVLLLAGVSAWQTSHWRDNTSLFTNCLAVNPGSIMANNNLGRVLGEAGQVQLATEHFLAALETDPDVYMTHFNLGAAYTRREDHRAAEVHYRRAVELKPRAADAWRSLGRVYIKLGDEQQALECHAKWLEITSLASDTAPPDE